MLPISSIFPLYCYKRGEGCTSEVMAAISSANPMIIDVFIVN